MLKTQSLGECCWHEPMLGLEVGPGGHPMSPSHTGRTWLRVSAYVHLGRLSKGDPSPSYCLISHQTLGRTRSEASEPPSEKTAPTPGVCVVTQCAGICEIQHKASHRNYLWKCLSFPGILNFRSCFKKQFSFSGIKS